MAQSKKKIPIKEITEKLNLESPVSTFEYEGMEITVKEKVPLSTMMEMSTFIYNMVFSDDGKTYYPQLYNYVFLSVIFDTYTNIKLPKDYDLSYQIIYHGDLKDEIMSRIDENQIKEIEKSANKLIDHHINAHFSAGRALDNLTNGINEFSKILTEVRTMVSDEELKAIFMSSIDPSGPLN